MKKIILMMGVSALCATNLFAAAFEVKSPDGQLSVSIDETDGALSYSLKKGSASLVNSSALQILDGAKMAVTDHAVRSSDSSWTPTWGQFSTIHDTYNELSLSVTANGAPMTLLCRVFDTGLGIRFELAEKIARQRLVFAMDYNMDHAAGKHYFPAGERGVSGPVQLTAKSKINVPLVSECDEGVVLALLESDIYSADKFESMAISVNADGRIHTQSRPVVTTGSGQVTPWRVILVGNSQADLLVNTVVLNLAAPCALDDDSWVKAGKGLWDWRMHGYDNGEFAYGINTKSYLRQIDFCAANGMDYLTVDDHWFDKASKEGMHAVDEVDLPQVVAYAKEKGVKICLYYDRRRGAVPNEPLFKNYASYGASAMKYGFHGNQATFTRSAIQNAAKNHMLINFHDGPCPMSGVERTMPNLITREYCHAQQDCRRAFTPEMFLKMAMVNALVGPMDQANGNFGIKSINAGERQKGPRLRDSYISTVVSESARCLVVYTGLITLPDAPEEYLKKADLFEFLKTMPATWDETCVPNAKMGEYITVARRTGDTWFVGSVNDETAKTLEVTLDFLDPNVTYEATLYQDAPDSHGVKNPEVYEISTQTVKQGDVIAAKMAVGGGHAMTLRPIK